MKRRDFIRTAAIAVPAIATSNVTVAHNRKSTEPEKNEEAEIPSLQFRNGKF